MNHPTDPMTPVRALIEAAGKADAEFVMHVETAIEIACAAEKSIPSISQLLSEHDRVVALITELHKLETPGHNDYIDVSAEKSAYEWCADRLAAILEGK